VSTGPCVTFHALDEDLSKDSRYRRNECIQIGYQELTVWCLKPLMLDPRVHGEPHA
jgi:hypothetical protein